MKIQEFFDLAKAKGVSEAQIQIKKTSSLSMSLFHHEMDNYNVNDSQNVIACGIVKGKFGSCRTEKLDETAFPFLVDGIIESAGVSEKTETAELFKGSEKYHKKNVFNKELGLVPVEKKIALLHLIEEGIFAYDKRISEVESVQYSEEEIVAEFYNSFGLKLKQKSNYFVLIGAADAKVNDEIKNSWNLFIGNDFTAFEPKPFIKKLGDRVLAKFGGAPCASNKYPTVLKNTVFSDLVGYFVGADSSEEVQKKSSFLVGKLNAPIASKKVTISEKPLTKNVFFSYFDDEGVSEYNKDIIKKGVLLTYLYNRETAKKDGVQSTGNAQWRGDKIGIGFGNIFVKGSKKTFDELISPIKEGVYITEIEGLLTGVNENSGDFSCQAQGFMIRNGKLSEPLNLITLSGNLLKIFADVKGLDDNYEITPDSITSPDAYIKETSIGGK
jgi:PmbA protein